MEGILESFAEYYSAELSQKVKRGRKESLIKGQYVGGRVAFGYYVKDKKVCINEQQAEIVKQVFNDYISGIKLKDIAIKLNSQGITNVLGGKFNINVVSRLLRNKIYTGQYFINGTISYRQLNNAMYLGRLGQQFVLKSKKAFDRINFLGSETAESSEWYAKKMLRDKTARREYFSVERNRRQRGDLYITQIIDEEMMPDDPRLR